MAISAKRTSVLDNQSRSTKVTNFATANESDLKISASATTFVNPMSGTALDDTQQTPDINTDRVLSEIAGTVDVTRGIESKNMAMINSKIATMITSDIGLQGVSLSVKMDLEASITSNCNILSLNLLGKFSIKNMNLQVYSILALAMALLCMGIVDAFSKLESYLVKNSIDVKVYGKVIQGILTDTGTSNPIKTMLDITSSSTGATASLYVPNVGVSLLGFIGDAKVTTKDPEADYVEITNALENTDARWKTGSGNNSTNVKNVRDNKVIQELSIKASLNTQRSPDLTNGTVAPLSASVKLHILTKRI